MNLIFTGFLLSFLVIQVISCNESLQETTLGKYQKGALCLPSMPSDLYGDMSMDSLQAISKRSSAESILKLYEEQEVNPTKYQSLQKWIYQALKESFNIECDTSSSSSIDIDKDRAFMGLIIMIEYMYAKQTFHMKSNYALNLMDNSHEYVDVQKYYYSIFLEIQRLIALNSIVDDEEVDVDDEVLQIEIQLRFKLDEALFNLLIKIQMVMNKEKSVFNHTYSLLKRLTASKNNQFIDERKLHLLYAKLTSYYRSLQHHAQKMQHFCTKNNHFRISNTILSFKAHNVLILNPQQLRKQCNKFKLLFQEGEESNESNYFYHVDRRFELATKIFQLNSKGNSSTSNQPYPFHALS